MKKTQIILIIIGVLVLIGFVSSFSYWFLYMKPETEISGLEKEREDLCAEFPKIEGEITCQEARKIALGEYPGEVRDINKAIASYQYGRPPGVKTEQRDVWIIKIKLEEPILPLPVEEGPQYSTEEVGVVIDRYQGEVLFLQTSLGQ